MQHHDSINFTEMPSLDTDYTDSKTSVDWQQYGIQPVNNLTSTK